jgi:hypothetical protein
MSLSPALENPGYFELHPCDGTTIQGKRGPTTSATGCGEISPFWENTFPDFTKKCFILMHFFCQTFDTFSKISCS